MENSGVFSVDEKELLIPSIYAASFVYAKGIRLVSVVTNQGRSAKFAFANEDGGADSALLEFYSGTPISGRELFEALGQLKREANEASGRPAAVQAR